MPRALESYEVEVGCGLIANISSCCDTPGLDLATAPADPQEAGRREAAFDMARQTLNLLTAGQVANCPVTVRPCSPGCCATAGWSLWGGLRWFPENLGNGIWINACGCRNPCECERVEGLDLGGPIADVSKVVVDGSPVDPADYALIGGRWLYRLNGGGSWPTVQDLDLPSTSPGTFELEFRPGYPLGPEGERALGRLVCEYLKSMCGQKCELPNNVTSLSRNGVTMQLTTGLFSNNLTGIRQVDIYVESLNPHHLKTIPTVYSPDVRRSFERA